MMWYYAEGDEPIGPLSEDQVRAAIAEDRIAPATLVWRDGLPQWIPAAQTTEFGARFGPPPSVLSRAASDDRSRFAQESLRQTLAGPWPRFFARTLDLLLIAYVITFVVGIVAVLYFPQIYVVIFSVNENLFGLMLVPISMVACAIILEAFGNTLGRWLFGIRLVRLADKPSFTYYLRRELAVWVAGLGLGIPIVTIVTNYLQYRRVSKKEPASYDAGETTVLSAPISVFRPILGVACLLLLFGGAVLLQVTATQDERAFSQTKSWTNPLTNRTVEIAGHWEPSQLAADSGKFYRFASDSLLLECLLGVEDISGYVASTDAYASAIQAVLQDTLEFHDDWAPVEVNGQQALRTYAKVKSDGTADVQITVLVDRTRAWRTLLFARGRNADSVDEGRELLNALWSTVEVTD